MENDLETMQSATQKQLRQIVEQIERLEEEKRALAGDIRDKFLEAKAFGYDVKALRQVVKLRRKSSADRREEEAVLATYMHALGMLADTPLGGWAIDQSKKPGDSAHTA